jgi:hypothetical protein
MTIRGIAMKSSMALMLVGLTVLQGAAHAADPALTCETAKLKEAAKYGACLLGADAKAAKAGAAPDATKCDAKFTPTWFKIEGKAAGACPSDGDAADVQRDVTDFRACITAKLGGVPRPNCFPALPATGETTPSFGPGDDADVQAGAAMAFVDNADGTITDLNTGLMWEKKLGAIDLSSPTTCTTESGTCADPHDPNNTYSWSAGTTAYDGTVVSIFLKQLNDRCDRNPSVACITDADCMVPGGACGLAGHRDWRLPNMKELGSIVDMGRSTYPSIHPAFHGVSCGACTERADPDCSCTFPYASYWSATTTAEYGGYRGNAWYVFFVNGLTDRTSKTSSSYARAVRGGS